MATCPMFVHLWDYNGTLKELVAQRFRTEFNVVSQILG